MKGIIVFLISMTGVGCLLVGEVESTFGKSLVAGEVSSSFGKPLMVGEAAATFGC